MLGWKSVGMTLPEKHNLGPSKGESDIGGEDRNEFAGLLKLVAALGFTFCGGIAAFFFSA